MGKFDINSNIAKDYTYSYSQTSQEDEIQEQNDEHSRKLQEAVDKWDDSDDGKIMEDMLTGNNFVIQDNNGQFTTDKDGDNALNFDEFATIFTNLSSEYDEYYNELRDEHRNLISSYMALQNEDGTFIPYDENGNDPSGISDFLNVMFQTLDKDGDGVISKEEFDVISEHDGRTRFKAMDIRALRSYFAGINKETLTEEIEKEKSEITTQKKKNEKINEFKEKYSQLESQEDKDKFIKQLKSTGFYSQEELDEIMGKTEADKLLEENNIDNNTKSTLDKMIANGAFSSGEELVEFLISNDVKNTYNDEQKAAMIEYVNNKMNINTEHSTQLAQAKENYQAANGDKEAQHRILKNILISNQYTDEDIMEITGLDVARDNLPADISSELIDKFISEGKYEEVDDVIQALLDAAIITNETDTNSLRDFIEIYIEINNTLNEISKETKIDDN